MGILDVLSKRILDVLTKRLWGKPEYVPVWDPQCVRHKLLTLRLPTGWRFTQVEQMEFAASGPDCTVSFRFVIQTPMGIHRVFTPEDVRAASRSQVMSVVRAIFNSDAKEVQAPEGFLWFEAVDTQGKNKRLQIALLNTKPRSAFAGVFVFHVTCSVPSTAMGDLTAQRFEAVRWTLRAAEWS
jgi:hypothetical protein